MIDEFTLNLGRLVLVVGVADLIAGTTAALRARKFSLLMFIEWLWTNFIGRIVPVVLLAAMAPFSGDEAFANGVRAIASTFAAAYAAHVLSTLREKFAE